MVNIKQTFGQQHQAAPETVDEGVGPDLPQELQRLVILAQREVLRLQNDLNISTIQYKVRNVNAVYCRPLGSASCSTSV